MGQVNLLKNEKNKFLEKKLDFEFIFSRQFLDFQKNIIYQNRFWRDREP